MTKSRFVKGFFRTLQYMYLNVEHAHIYMYPGYINLKMQQFVSLSVMTSFNITYITCPSDKLNVTHTHDLYLLLT